METENRRNPWREPGAIGCQLVFVALLLAMIVMLIISAAYRSRHVVPHTLNRMQQPLDRWDGQHALVSCSQSHGMPQEIPLGCVRATP